MRKIFTLFILLLLLPVTALAAGEDKPGTLWVGQTQITADGYWKTNPDGTLTTEGANKDNYNVYYDGNGTLTLNGATIQGGTSTGSVPYGAGIYAQCSNGQSVTLTIKLIGENTITGYYGIYVNAEISADSNGTDASLTITGENNGSLEVSGSNHGIFVKSGTGNASLNIEKATVTSSTNGGYAAGVYVQSGVNATGSPNISLSVNGGSLTASGTGNSDGILFYVGQSQATSATTSLTITDHAIVDARNGGISASRISETLPTPTPTGDNSSGIVFDGTEGTVYGDVTLDESLTINQGETLTVPDGSSLNCNDNLTNNGRIINYGAINGTATGIGTVAIPLTADMIKLQKEEFFYIGNAIEPIITVSKDDVTYTKDTDYTVSYSDNTNAGRATVTVTPKTDGDSRLVGGAVDIEFTIAKATPTITLTVPKEDDLVYDGADKKATAIVKGVENETEELTATITYYSDETCQTKVDETKNAGTYYVKASFAETKNYMAMEETASFTITKAFATLSFTKETVSATIGETVENTLTVTPEGVTVSYSSSEETVATVDASTGAITLVGTGETIITATISDPNYTGYPASYTLTVSKATLAGNEITAEGATNISIEKNGTPFKLTAIVTKDDLGTGGKWEWTSDNETVATVAAEQGTLRAATSTSSATVTPLSVGTATITATYEDNKYVGSVTYTVTVTKPYVPDPISYYNIYVEDVCDGVEVSTSKQVVREGGSITVYVEKDTANYTFDNFKVYYKRSYYGGWEELKEGTQPGEYPIKNIWTHIYIKALGAEEKEDPTGIESIEGVKVYTKDGSLYVQTPQREQVIIVSMSGAVVKNEEQIGLKQYHGLQPGIYIVRVGDRAYKVRLN